jgi:hypothetical protein
MISGPGGDMFALQHRQGSTASDVTQKVITAVHPFATLSY